MSCTFLATQSTKILDDVEHNRDFRVRRLWSDRHTGIFALALCDALGVARNGSSPYIQRLDFWHHLPLPLPPPAASSFSSASSPGRKISCPLPFLTQYAATQPIDATDPTIHQAIPITPRSIHTPNHQPAKIGPRVRKVAEQAWPSPCIVPKTEGCGDELLSRMMVAGRAKVRAATCRNNTEEMPSQIAAPEAGSGAFDVDGRSAMYGARK
jgi:hypothetical protein